MKKQTAILREASTASVVEQTGHAVPSARTFSCLLVRAGGQGYRVITPRSAAGGCVSRWCPRRRSLSLSSVIISPTTPTTEHTQRKRPTGVSARFALSGHTRGRRKCSGGCNAGANERASPDSVRCFWPASGASLLILKPTLGLSIPSQVSRDPSSTTPSKFHFHLTR
uniref:Uncharacterized protein n=1 Tax=Panagrellus redivivus TaxID=6233 RepID=A0A7E4VU08_PANRE